MNTPKRLVLYTRVSTGKQCASLETQTEALQAYCKAFGHVVVGEFSDTQSGKSDEDRKGLQTALGALDSPDIDGMVVYKLDRLGRNTRDVLGILEEKFQATGKGLHMLDLQIDTSSPMGKVFFTIMAAYAEFEREQTIARTIAGLQYRKATGMSYTGRIYGVVSAKKTAMVDAPDEQAVISLILKKRALNQSFHEIAVDLQSSGYPPPRKTRSGHVCEWHKETVRRIWQRHNSPQGVE